MTFKIIYVNKVPVRKVMSNHIYFLQLARLKFHLLDCVAGHPCSQAISVDPQLSRGEKDELLQVSGTLPGTRWGWGGIYCLNLSV